MRSLRTSTLMPAALFLALPLLLHGQIAGGNCNPSMLNGTYSFVLSGRAISAASIVTDVFQSNGTATFDGQGKVSFSVTGNTNQAVQKPLSNSGTFTLPSNCSGTVSITGGALFIVTVWNNGANFAMAGADGTYTYSANGSVAPASCLAATISGAYTYSATGFNTGSLSGTAITGGGDESGLLQFDGQGNVAYSFAIAANGASTQATATGSYTVASACTGTISLTDSSSKPIAMNFTITDTAATSVDLIESSAGFIRTGTAHSTFLNPSQSIGNVASYAVNSTPPGSVFVIFGSNLATRSAGAATSTLPTTLLNTSVLVNGAAAPLFYVDQNQIDVQMPWDTPGGVSATVLVKNGTATSNAVAVSIPSTGTPGISVYGNNRAVVVNKDGQVNSASLAASVGDEVVAYFTGGGPVQSPGKLVSGSPAPSGLSPVTGANKVTVNNIAAKVVYIGLTPGSIGLYQVNFLVPQVAKGTFPLVITIAGQASNSPVITVN